MSSKCFVTCCALRQHQSPWSSDGWRDWNAEFQALWESCPVSADAHQQRRAMLQQLVADFEAKSMELALRLSRQQQGGSPPDGAPSTPLAEVPGYPLSYLEGNVLVRVTPNTRLARQQVAAYRAVLLAEPPGMCVPLTAIVMFRGICFFSQALIPVGKESPTLYRGDGAPDAVEHGIVQAGVRKVLDTINVTPDLIGSGGKMMRVEVLGGLDGRFYVVQASGFLPPIHPIVENVPFRRYESLVLVDTPASYSSDRSHATEMGIVLFFRSLAEIIGGAPLLGSSPDVAADAKRQVKLCDALHASGVNLSFLGSVSKLALDEESMTLERRTIALHMFAIEMISRAVKSLFYAEMHAQFAAREAIDERVVIAKAVHLLFSDDTTMFAERLTPVIARKFTVDFEKDKPTIAALEVVRSSRRRLLVRRFCDLCGIELVEGVPPPPPPPPPPPDRIRKYGPRANVAAVQAAEAAAKAEADALLQARAEQEAVAAPKITDCRFVPVAGKWPLLPVNAEALTEQQLKTISAPTRLFGFGLPRAALLLLRRGDYAGAMSAFSLVSTDRKQRFGRDSVAYALAGQWSAYAQILAGQPDGGAIQFADGMPHLGPPSVFIGRRCVMIADVLFACRAFDHAMTYYHAGLLQFHASVPPVFQLPPYPPGTVGGVQYVPPPPGGIVTRQGPLYRVKPLRYLEAIVLYALSGAIASVRRGFEQESGRRAAGSDSWLTADPLSIGGTDGDVPPDVVAIAVRLAIEGTASRPLHNLLTELGALLIASRRFDEASVVLEHAVNVAALAFRHESAEYVAALQAAAYALFRAEWMRPDTANHTSSRSERNTARARCLGMMEQSLDAAANLYGAKSLPVAIIQNNFAALLMQVGELRDALRNFYEALETFQKCVGTPTSPASAGDGDGAADCLIARHNINVLWVRLRERAAVRVQRAIRKSQARQRAKKATELRRRKILTRTESKMRDQISQTEVATRDRIFATFREKAPVSGDSPELPARSRSPSESDPFLQTSQDSNRL